MDKMAENVMETGEKKQKNSLVSIIVPVYNYEEYVEKCIKSLIMQTYKELEIIIVDDGSTDKSGEIIDRLAKTDKRIKAIHKDNGGIGSAIKAGLEHAEGKYIAFLDSDDYMDLSAYENLVLIAERTGADMVIFGLCMTGLNGEIRSKSTSKSVTLDTNIDIMKDYLLHEMITPLSRKFCRSSLLGNLKMMDYTVGIDETISIQLMSKCKKLVKIEECYYFALGGPEKDSVSRRAIDGIYVEKQMQMHRDIIRYIFDNKIPYRKHYILRYLRFLSGRYVVIYKLQKNKEVMDIIYKEFLYFWSRIRNTQEFKNSHIKVKIQLYIFKLLPELYAQFRGIGFKRR